MNSQGSSCHYNQHQTTRRGAALAICITAMLCIQCAPVQSHKRTLQFKHFSQKTRNWCWAASLAMVQEYVYGITMSDCEIAAAYDRFRGGLGMCCAGDRQCDQGRSLADMLTLMHYVLKLEYQFYNRPLSYGEVVAHISAGQPMLAILSGPQGEHVVAIDGFRTPSMIDVLDPERGFLLLTHKELIVGMHTGIWVGTILITSKRQV